MADINIPSVYDDVSVSENVVLKFLYLTIDTYDTVSVAETKITVVQIHWHSGNSNLPVWELEGAFAKAFQGSSDLPTWELAASFGMRMVEERLGVWELSSTMSTIEQFTGDSKLPVGQISGSFGSRLNENIPIHTLSATLLVDGTMQLDEYIPLRTVSGSMYEEGTFQLDTYSIPWTFDGTIIVTADSLSLESKIPGAFIPSMTMYEEVTFSLDSNIPPRTLAGTLISDTFRLSSNIPGAFYLDGMLGADYYLSLDTNIPVRSLSATLYSESMIVDSYLPVWRMTSVGNVSISETEVPGDPDGDITDESFYGVLRYVRP